VNKTLQPEIQNGVQLSNDMAQCTVKLGWLGSRVVSLLRLRRRKAQVQIAVATLSGNSLRLTVHTHYASSPNSKTGSSPLKGCRGNCRPGGK